MSSVCIYTYDMVYFVVIQFRTGEHRAELIPVQGIPIRADVNISIHVLGGISQCLTCVSVSGGPVQASFFWIRFLWVIKVEMRGVC